MLNALIRQDLFEGERCRVAARTALFLTMGSPLDKTAFIFRASKTERLDIREAAAATLQPMIDSYAHRPARWINLWTPNDWISGSLDYYDNPDDPLFAALGVRNRIDEEASTPLAAHGEYWTGRRFAHCLYEAIMEQPHASAAGRRELA